MISLEKNKSIRSPIKRRSISPSPSLRYSTNIRQSATSSSTNQTSDRNKSWSYGSKKTCLCSPTNHPGSFRCSLHKNSRSNGSGNSASYQTHRLFARRSAMTNSLVRSGKVEGDLVKRALAALIRPSSHQQRRRSDFRRRLSRLSVMSLISLSNRIFRRPAINITRLKPQISGAITNLQLPIT